MPDIIFRDVVITGVSSTTNPCGEYGSNDDKEPQSIMIARLLNHLSQMIDKAGQLHRQDNCIDNSDVVKPDKKNNITRLITNEFFFYTKKPLSLDEFQQIQQKIADLAKTMPENLHLILASFAIRIDNRIINAVSHVQCSPRPKMYFSVKNQPSKIDPIYTISKNETRWMLPNCINDGRNKLPQSLVINGIGNCEFTFSCIAKIKTAGRVPFYICTEICLDHKLGFGKKDFLQQFARDLNRKDQTIPLHYSHVIVSNSVKHIAKHSLGVVTHADPLAACRFDVGSAEIPAYDCHFGTPFKMVVTDEYPCSQLAPALFNQADTRNQIVISPETLPLITKLEEYISFRVNEMNHINPTKDYKYKLLSMSLGYSAAEKIKAARHLIDYLIDYNHEPLTKKEIQILQNGVLGKIIADLAIDLNALSTSTFKLSGSE